MLDPIERPIAETLFLAAMERPNDRREKFLRDVAPDEGHFEAALKLVQAAEQSQDFMSTCIGLPAFAPSLDIGTQVDEWRIEAVIGSGGMGEVYSVRRDKGDFEQRAALKLARTNDAKYLQQFEAERQTLARLEHPHIGRLIGGGQTADGHPYMIMELVIGPTILEYIRKRNLSVEARIELFQSLCEAVSHAHGRLVLHRDIKPANVLVTENGDIKLIDFGVAGDLDRNGTQGFLPLTKAYAAPELLAGDNGTVATDIYALGCVLHEVLTGKRIDENKGGLPKDLQAVISKTAETSPDHRYVSVTSLSSDLSRYLRKEPIEARAGGGVYRFGKLLSRYRFASAAIGLFLVALIAGLAGTYTQMTRAQAASAKAEASALQYEFEARTTSAFQYSLQRLYGADPTVDNNIVSPDIVDDSLLNLTHAVQSRFDGDNLDDAFLLYSVGQHFVQRDNHVQCIEHFTPLTRITPGTSPILDTLYLSGKSDLANCYGVLKQFDKMRPLLDQLKTEHETIRGSHPLDRVQDASNYAVMTRDKADQQAALTLIRETLLQAESGGMSVDNVGFAYLYDTLALMLLSQHDIPGMISAFETSFDYTRDGRAASVETLDAAISLARYQIHYGRDGTKPLEYLPEYLVYAMNDFGDVAKHSRIQTLIAEAASLTGDWGKVLEATQAATKILVHDKALSQGEYYVVTGLQSRALTHLGRYKEAKAVLETGANVFHSEQDNIKQTYPQYECEFVMSHMYIEALQESRDKALKLYDEALKTCETQPNVNWRGAYRMRGMTKRVKAQLETLPG